MIGHCDGWPAPRPLPRAAEVLIEPVERLADEPQEVVRHVASFEHEVLLQLGRGAEQLEQSLLRVERCLKSLSPLIMSTGTLTRGAKLAGWISGG